jgi:ribonuclease D
VSATFDHDFAYVATPDDLARFADELLPAIEGRVLACDVEEDRDQRYYPRVALIQLTFGEHDVILDPMLLPDDLLAPVVEAFCMTASVVVVHGGRNDVAGLKREWGVGPARTGDTQIAARFLGAREFGLAAVVGDTFGVKLDKSARRSDWTKRPLTAEQMAYARADTTYLAELWTTLEERVHAAGWADALYEECGAIGEIGADHPEFDTFAFDKIKGVSELTPIERARLAELWNWRERTAARMDLHPSRMLAPWALLTIARRGASALGGGRIPSGMSQSTPRESRDELAAALDSPTALSERPLTPRARHTHRLEPALMRDRTERLAGWRATESERSGLEPGFLAPRGVLEEVARLASDDARSFESSAEIKRWRAKRYGDTWSRLLQRG